MQKINHDCCGCGACLNACPKNAITMKIAEDGFSYPYIDKKKCINCGLCNKVCPNMSIINQSKFKKEYYIGYAKDNDLLMKSSSGAAFPLIATRFIENGGVVVGAILDKDNVVKHVIVNSKEELDALFGSKYVQSDLSNVFKKIESLLKKGTTVLFCGTPCQSNGLHLFLKKEYANLYIVDFICHGVPSNAFWQKYLKCLETKNGKLQKYNFRAKDNGWRNFCFKKTFKNKTIKSSLDEDGYAIAFLKNYSLRPSCYDCKAKGEKRFSDITIADCWGSRDIDKIYNKNGVSTIIVNSDKGNYLFNMITDSLVYEKSNYDNCIKDNPTYFESVKHNDWDIQFKEDSIKLEYKELRKKYKLYLPLKKRIIRKLVNIKRNLKGRK